MNAITIQERVKAALSHHKPDRVPRYEVFLPGYIEKWRRECSPGESVNIYDYYPETDIGSDSILAMQEGPFTSRVSTEETGTDTFFHRDSWNRLQRCSHSGTFFEVMEVALNEKKTLDTLVWEDPWTQDNIAGYKDRARQAAQRFCPVTGVMGLFMSSYYLRGEFELLIDLMEDKGFARSLADRLSGFLGDVGAKALETTDTWDTAIWVYDELGNNKSSVISPDTFEQVYLEPYKRVIGYWKSLGASNVILHCDGNCLPLLDLLIEAGFTGLQGVNPSAGMTVPEVKAKYGKKLALIGGICNIHVLAKGTRQDIERNVKSVIEVAQDGGVIIGTHSIDYDIPIANYNYYYKLLESR
ncbi:MAG: uroporphyrinogen decarboxylase family protein [bacterium]|nr:uroporphyrinogen decarboxylase family protein [bacterium]